MVSKFYPPIGVIIEINPKKVFVISRTKEGTIVLELFYYTLRIAVHHVSKPVLSFLTFRGDECEVHHDRNSTGEGEKKLVDLDDLSVIINLQHFVVRMILPLGQLQTTKQVIFHLSLHVALVLNSSHLVFND